MSRYSALATIHHNVVAPYLRHLFKCEWDQCYPHMPWMDDNPSLLNFISLERNKTKAQKSLKSGDHNDWDLTALYYVLLYSDSIGQKLKQTLNIHLAIDQLRQSRNVISHTSPSTYIGEVDFQQWCGKVQKCLEELGFHDAQQRLQAVIQQHDLVGDIAACCKTDFQCYKCGIKVNQKLQISFKHFSMMCGFLILLAFGILVLTSVMFNFPANAPHAGTQLPTELVMEAKESNKNDLRSNSILLNISDFNFPVVTPKLFVGRTEEKASLIQSVHDPSINLISVVSPAAFGKTALSMAIAERFQMVGDYGVAFVDFKNQTQPFSLIANTILSALGVRNIHNDDYIEVITKISTPSKTNILLILDNIDPVLEGHKNEFIQFLLHIKTFLRVTFVTTSSNEIHWNDMHFTSMVIKLQPLDLHSSVTLVDLIHPKIRTPNSVALTKHIAEVTGGIPLLLEIIGHQLEQKVYRPDEFMDTINISNSLHVIPSDHTTFYPLLTLQLSKISPSLLVHFLRTSCSMKAQDINFALCNNLLDLGYLKLYNGSTLREETFKMHDVLIKFVAYLQTDTVLQFVLFLPMSPLTLKQLITFSILSIVILILITKISPHRKSYIFHPIASFSFTYILFLFCFFAIAFQAANSNEIFELPVVTLVFLPSLCILALAVWKKKSNFKRPKLTLLIPLVLLHLLLTCMLVTLLYQFVLLVLIYAIFAIKTQIICLTTTAVHLLLLSCILAAITSCMFVFGRSLQERSIKYNGKFLDLLLPIPHPHKFSSNINGPLHAIIKICNIIQRQQRDYIISPSEWVCLVRRCLSIYTCYLAIYFIAIIVQNISASDIQLEMLFQDSNHGHHITFYAILHYSTNTLLPFSELDVTVLLWLHTYVLIIIFLSKETHIVLFAQKFLPSLFSTWLLLFILSTNTFIKNAQIRNLINRLKSSFISFYFIYAFVYCMRIFMDDIIDLSTILAQNFFIFSEIWLCL